ncbi:MAG: hypothetical protein R3F34_11685 [Planctomycetota bacterium]
MGGELSKRWNLSLRVIEGIPVDRARVRITLTYDVTDRLRVGLEANPKDEDYGLLVNYRVWDETDVRPALIVGTSSDRIGTPSGRAYYATFSKDLEAWTGLPIAPYVGTAFGEYEDAFELVGGMVVRWSKRLVSTHVWDGHNLHHMLDYFVDDWRIGVVVAEQGSEHYVGGSVGFRF